MKNPPCSQCGKEYKIGLGSDNHTWYFYCECGKVIKSNGIRQSPQKCKDNEHCECDGEGVCRNVVQEHDKIGLRTLRIIDAVRCFHQTEHCPHKGNCLTEKQMTQEVESVIQANILHNREQIKQDLLAIADKGEYEDMRREVESYFEVKL